MLEEALSPLYLKKGKEKPLLQRHHWIYSGAISKKPEKGPLVEVFSHSGEKLGTALYHPGHSIAAHMLSFGVETIEETLLQRVQQANKLRRAWFDPKKTNSYRLLHAEGDGIPGVIVDVYDDILVLQISHPGMESLRDLLVQTLVQVMLPRAIYEKSTTFLRQKEGLSPKRGLLYGRAPLQLEILENSIPFFVDIEEGQKTGFFLDQREMRQWVRELSFGKKVLNCFAYSGGFSVAALLGGAISVDSVESSPKCVEWIEKNVAKTGKKGHRTFLEDVFTFLKKEPLDYDLVILDPPAFVKKKEDVPRAFRAYLDMNAHVLERLRPGSLLLTSSCSYHIGEELFQNILFRASLQAKRSVKIVGGHRLAMDHPVSIFHPETKYLKSFLLSV